MQKPIVNLAKQRLFCLKITSVMFVLAVHHEFKQVKKQPL